MNGVWLALAILGVASATNLTEAQVFDRLFADLDRDGDGWVSRNEFSRKGDLRHFAALDRDQSDTIDVDELAEWVRLTPPRPERNDALKPKAAPVAVPSPGSARPAVATGVPATGEAGAPLPVSGWSQAEEAPEPEPAPLPWMWMSLAFAAVGLGVLGWGLARGQRGGRRRRRK